MTWQGGWCANLSSGASFLPHTGQTKGLDSSCPPSHHPLRTADAPSNGRHPDQSHPSMAGIHLPFRAGDAVHGAPRTGWKLCIGICLRGVHAPIPSFPQRAGKAPSRWEYGLLARPGLQAGIELATIATHSVCSDSTWRTRCFPAFIACPKRLPSASPGIIRSTWQSRHHSLPGPQKMPPAGPARLR